MEKNFEQNFWTNKLAYCNCYANIKYEESEFIKIQNKTPDIIIIQVKQCFYECRALFTRSHRCDRPINASHRREENRAAGVTE